MLIPAPVKATMWRAVRDRASREATSEQPIGPAAEDPVADVNVKPPQWLPGSRDNESRKGLCPYIRDGTIGELEQSRNPAHFSNAAMFTPQEPEFLGSIATRWHKGCAEAVP